MSGHVQYRQGSINDNVKNPTRSRSSRTFHRHLAWCAHRILNTLTSSRRWCQHTASLLKIFSLHSYSTTQRYKASRESDIFPGQADAPIGRCMRFSRRPAQGCLHDARRRSRKFEYDIKASKELFKCILPARAISCSNHAFCPSSIRHNPPDNSFAAGRRHDATNDGRTTQPGAGIWCHLRILVS